MVLPPSLSGKKLAESYLSMYSNVTLHLDVLFAAVHLTPMAKWQGKIGGEGMEKNVSVNAQIDEAWGEFIGHSQRLMDDVMPYLPVAEQGVYHRLFRLSYGRRSAYA